MMRFKVLSFYFTQWADSLSVNYAKWIEVPPAQKPLSAKERQALGKCSYAQILNNWIRLWVTNDPTIPNAYKLSETDRKLAWVPRIRLSDDETNGLLKCLATLLLNREKQIPKTALSEQQQDFLSQFFGGFKQASFLPGSGRGNTFTVQYQNCEDEALNTAKHTLKTFQTRETDTYTQGSLLNAFLYQHRRPAVDTAFNFFLMNCTPQVHYSPSETLYFNRLFMHLMSNQAEFGLPVFPEPETDYVGLRTLSTQFSERFKAFLPSLRLYFYNFYHDALLLKSFRKECIVLFSQAKSLSGLPVQEAQAKLADALSNCPFVTESQQELLYSAGELYAKGGAHQTEAERALTTLFTPQVMLWLFESEGYYTHAPSPTHDTPLTDVLFHSQRTGRVPAQKVIDHQAFTALYKATLPLLQYGITPHYLMQTGGIDLLKKLKIFSLESNPHADICFDFLIQSQQHWVETPSVQKVIKALFRTLYTQTTLKTDTLNKFPEEMRSFVMGFIHRYIAADEGSIQPAYERLAPIDPDIAMAQHLMRHRSSRRMSTYRGPCSRLPVGMATLYTFFEALRRNPQLDLSTELSTLSSGPTTHVTPLFGKWASMGQASPEIYQDLQLLSSHLVSALSRFPDTCLNDFSVEGFTQLINGLLDQNIDLTLKGLSRLSPDARSHFLEVVLSYLVDFTLKHPDRISPHKTFLWIRRLSSLYSENTLRSEFKHILNRVFATLTDFGVRNRRYRTHSDRLRTTCTLTHFFSCFNSEIAKKIMDIRYPHNFIATDLFSLPLDLFKEVVRQSEGKTLRLAIPYTAYENPKFNPQLNQKLQALPAHVEWVHHHEHANTIPLATLHKMLVQKHRIFPAQAWEEYHRRLSESPQTQSVPGHIPYKPREVIECLLENYPPPLSRLTITYCLSDLLRYSIATPLSLRHVRPLYQHLVRCASTEEDKHTLTDIIFSCFGVSYLDETWLSSQISKVKPDVFPYIVRHFSTTSCSLETCLNLLKASQRHKQLSTPQIYRDLFCILKKALQAYTHPSSEVSLILLQFLGNFPDFSASERDAFFRMHGTDLAYVFKKLSDSLATTKEPSLNTLTLYLDTLEVIHTHAQAAKVHFALADCNVLASFIPKRRASCPAQLPQLMHRFFELALPHGMVQTYRPRFNVQSLGALLRTWVSHTELQPYLPAWICTVLSQFSYDLSDLFKLLKPYRKLLSPHRMTLAAYALVNLRPKDHSLKNVKKILAFLDIPKLQQDHLIDLVKQGNFYMFTALLKRYCTQTSASLLPQKKPLRSTIE